MNKSIQQVRQFHETFEHPVGSGPEHTEPLSIRQLRLKLLFEELAELAEAGDCKRTMSLLCNKYVVKLGEQFGDIEQTLEEYEEEAGRIADARGIHDGDNVNKLEELDALCDIQYVLSGKILTSGLHEIFDRNFDLVHQNNMSKAHRDRAHAEETLAKTLNGEGTIVDKKILMGQKPALPSKSFHSPAQPAVDEYQILYIVLNKDLKVIKPWDHKKVSLTLAK